MLRNRPLLLAFLFLCVTAPALAVPCDEQPKMADEHAICGIEAPEDMVALDERRLIVSSMEVTDHLYLLDTRTDELGPLRTELEPPPAAQRWGEPDCAPPVYMISHGIDLSRAADAPRLLVVNHGGRESVEMFELRQDGEATPWLQWRGCVLAAENAQFNDVAALPDGGFLATDPLTDSWKLPRMLLGALGMATGRVYRWAPGAGYSAVPGTEGAYPNGITLAADGARFYLNLYLDGEVREHALDSGEILRRVSVKKPDNSTLTADGRLLVASHRAGLPSLVGAIADEAGERNRIPFDIVVVDLDSFDTRILHRGDGEALGGGTVAVPAGERLYIGAFRGDRLLRVGGE